MRKLLFFLFLTASVIGAKAQNVQLHYDFGETRKLATATVEMFKPDDWGSTFFFVDMDFGGKAENGRTTGMNLAYFELSRGLKFWDAPVEAHVEYNGGFGRGRGFEYNLSNAYLAGPSYTWNSEDWSKIFTFKVHYKYVDQLSGDVDFNHHNVQFTGVWTMQFFENKLTFMGFADFWSEEVAVFDDEGNFSTAKWVFLTEPQLWYNATEHLSVGGEIEISNNFALNKGFMVNPTLAAKWNF